MNIRYALPAALLVHLMCLSSSPAKDYTFQPEGKPADSFLIKSGEKLLTIDKDGLLTFRGDSGGTFGIFNPDNAELLTSASEVEIEFRTEGQVTFGIFLRAQNEGGDSYMAFFGTGLNDSLTFNLCKTAFVVVQEPGKATMAQKRISDYRPGVWYKLRLRLRNEESGPVAFSADLTESGTTNTILELNAEDSQSPVTSPGLIGLRFVANKSGGGGVFQIKNISVSPN